MDIKRTVPLIVALLLFTGCNQAAKGPSGMPETAGPFAAVSEALETPETLEMTSLDSPGAELIPIEESFTEFEVVTVTASYTGEDDGLFEAAYRALTEVVWTDAGDALERTGNYLSKGEQGMIQVGEAPFNSLTLKEGAEVSPGGIVKGVFDDIRLATIEISFPGGDSFVMIFDIKENGTYLPVCGIWVSWRGGWRFERLGKARFFISSGSHIWGSGILIDGCEWYNIDTGRAEISYLDYVLEGDQGWCPLGWWAFIGKLSEPRITELEDGKTVLLEMDASCSLDREDGDDAFSTPYFKLEKTEPVRILYDLTENRAYAETGLDRWYFNVEGDADNTKEYCAPFLDELTELVNGNDAAKSWWAKWMLAGAPCDWEGFFAENGIVFEEETPLW